MATGLPQDVLTSQAGSAAAALIFRPLGRLRVAIIVKATFAFAPNAPMPRVDPQPILRAEIPHGVAVQSIRYSSDLSPYLPEADVLFTGHAYAPPGSPVRALRVRLAVLDGEQPLLDKTLCVQAPFPFVRLPLVYEWAYGGPGVVENPVGTGDLVGSEPPSIIDPARPGRPAGFGPISREWPARINRLRDIPLHIIETSAPELPAGFDWSYYQSAPPDQRIDHIRGDEWIVLEGLHPTLPSLRTRLPGAHAYAIVHGLSAFGIEEGRSIHLVADTLRIDGDEQRCTVVWRGSFPVSDPAAFDAMRIVAGVSLESAPDAFSTTVLLSDLAPPNIPGSTSTGSDWAPGGGTQLLEDILMRTVVFDESPALDPYTITLAEDENGASSAPVLPFRRAESGWSVGGVFISSASEPPSPRWTGTMQLSEMEQTDAATAAATPFMGAPEQPAPRQPSSPPPPRSPAPPSVAPALVEPPLPPLPAQSAPPEPEKPRHDPWAPSPAGGPMPAPRPRPPPGPPAPPPGLKTSVYGAFKKGR